MELKTILVCVFILMLYCPILKTLKCYMCSAVQEFCKETTEIECPPGVKTCYHRRQDSDVLKNEDKNCTPIDIDTDNICDGEELLLNATCKECDTDLCNTEQAHGATAKTHTSTLLFIAVSVLVPILDAAGLFNHRTLI